MMKKKIRKTLIIAGSIIGAVILLLGVATLLLNTSYVQQQLLQHATTLLTEKLGTRVEVNKVSVNLFVPSMALKGLCIDDQQGKSLLRMKSLTAEMSLESLWDKQFIVKQVKVEGLEARLVKTGKDSVANYQFLIDSLSKKKEPQKEKLDSPEEKEKEKWGLTLHLKHLRLKDTHISYQMAETKTTADLQQMDTKKRGEEYLFTIKNLHLTTDNGRPKKKSKSQRFDGGHLNLMVTAKGMVTPIGKDSLTAMLTETSIQDPATGIDINDLHLNAATNRKTLILTDVGFRQGSTTLQISKAHITLPNKKTEQELAYQVESLSGNVVLRDIAKPFVPALKNFQIPLQLTTQMSGTNDKMTFRKVQVHTSDRRLSLVAHGHISNLSSGQPTLVSFDVDKLLSKQGMAENVINQFIVKKLMMNQLHHLGDISYRGHFDVLNGQESFRGALTTNAGNLNFNFSLNDHTQRLSGAFSSSAIKVGDVMEMPKIGDVDCRAEFDIDISKQRTARIRRQKGGKLPIGTVKATVNDCSYKRIHVRNIDINIESDGADATGNIVQQGNRRQIHCDFIYSESDPKHKLRIMNAGISFGKKKLDDLEEPQDSTKIKKKKRKEEKKKKKKKEEEKNKNEKEPKT